MTPKPHPKATIVGTYQGVAGLAPRPFWLEEETGSHHGHGHVHVTRQRRGRIRLVWLSPRVRVSHLVGAAAVACLLLPPRVAAALVRWLLALGTPALAATPRRREYALR